jgi:predicted RNA-binding Zn ribbon-like protein
VVELAGRLLDDARAHGGCGRRWPALALANNGIRLGEVVAIAFAALFDGSFARLKACRNCHWSFYDYSPNRSATWCSMQLCGNRRKTRAYCRRRAEKVSDTKSV